MKSILTLKLHFTETCFICWIGFQHEIMNGKRNSTKSCFHASSTAYNKARRLDNQEGTIEAPLRTMFLLELRAQPLLPVMCTCQVCSFIQQATFASMTDAATVQRATDFNINTNNKRQLSWITFQSNPCTEHLNLTLKEKRKKKLQNKSQRGNVEIWVLSQFLGSGWCLTPYTFQCCSSLT